MKPYSYNNKNHNNMAEIAKWGESRPSGPSRVPTRTQSRTNRRLTNTRGRRAGAAEIRRAVADR